MVLLGGGNVIYNDFKTPSTFAQKNLYFSDGMGIISNADFRIERQSFRNCLFMYVTKGTLYVEQNGLHKLGPEEMVVMRLSEPHKYYSSKQDVATILWMHFGYKGPIDLLNYIEDEMGLPYIVTSSDAKGYIETCLEASKHNMANREYIYSEMVYKTLLLLSQMVNINKVNKDQTSKSNFMKLVNDYINQHLTEKPRLDTFAKTCGISKYHFIKLFNKYFHCTPITYYYKMKVENSKSRLSYTGDPIGLIAYNLGFDSQSHFSRVFKRFVGMSPSKYRQQH